MEDDRTMHITVAGKQVSTSDALRAHVEEGLGTITTKYFDHALEARVTFSKAAKGAGAFACDINLHAGRGLVMRGEGQGADAHRAFDEAAEHVAKRLRRYRRRVNEHARSQATARESSEVAREYVVHAGEDLADEATPIESADHPAVVAEDTRAVLLLTVGEASMRLDLEGLPVLVFRNRASEAINVVYRRADGHIGWIDPAQG